MVSVLAFYSDDLAEAYSFCVKFAFANEDKQKEAGVGHLKNLIIA